MLQRTRAYKSAYATPRYLARPKTRGYYRGRDAGHIAANKIARAFKLRRSRLARTNLRTALRSTRKYKTIGLARATPSLQGLPRNLLRKIASFL